MSHNFYSLFVNELKDIYSAEQQIINAMPNLIQHAASKKLKEALQDHLRETKMQLDRLDKIGRELNENLAGKDCSVIRSMIREAEHTLSEDYSGEVRDAAIINCAQRVEHYEIAVYGILKSFACHLKLDKVEDLLKQSSKEEGHADKILNEIAEGTLFSSGVNAKARKKAA